MKHREILLIGMSFRKRKGVMSACGKEGKDNEFLSGVIVQLLTTEMLDRDIHLKERESLELKGDGEKWVLYMKVKAESEKEMKDFAAEMTSLEGVKGRMFVKLPSTMTEIPHILCDDIEVKMLKPETEKQEDKKKGKLLILPAHYQRKP